MKLHLVPLLISTLTLLPKATAQADPLDIYSSYPSCDLCGVATAYVTRGSVFLPEGTGGILTSGLTCDAAEQLAADGSLSPASCLLLGLRVADECGCTNAGNPPGVSPSSPSAPSPTRPSGSSPTSPSGPTPTSPSGPTPTSPSGQTDGDPLTGTTFVRLDPIAGGTIPEDELSAVDRACATFLDEAISTISEVNCMTVVISTSDGDGPVEVQLIVTAMSTTARFRRHLQSLTVAEFSEDIRDAINDDQDGFIDALQNESSFFDTVTSVNSEVSSPVPEPDDGLSNLQIGAIVAGSIAFVLVLCAVLIASNRSQKSALAPASRGTSPPAETARKPRLTTTMWNPPSFTGSGKAVIPVASAAAVATAAHGSTDEAVTRAASMITDDNASLTDQSMTDGSTMSSLRPEMNSRVVQAPSGKLGIVIDTTLDGPVIHRVNENSPVFGQLFPGDVIVAVNNIDTRAMSAQAITSLMARTSKGRRNLTVLSADVSDEPAPGSDEPALSSGGVEESKDEEPEPIPAEETQEAAVVVAEETPVAEEPPIATPVPPEEASVPDEDDIASVASSLRSDMQPRLVKAPPGKLGIVIDTTNEGPMVNEIKEGSKLAGLVQVGDIIAKVNDVDTRAMSGAAITSLMVRTAKQTRTLTILGKDFPKQDDILM